MRFKFCVKQPQSVSLMMTKSTVNLTAHNVIGWALMCVCFMYVCGLVKAHRSILAQDTEPTVTPIHQCEGALV